MFRYRLSISAPAFIAITSPGSPLFVIRKRSGSLRNLPGRFNVKYLIEKQVGIVLMQIFFKSFPTFFPVSASISVEKAAKNKKDHL